MKRGEEIGIFLYKWKITIFVCLFVCQTPRFILFYFTFLFLPRFVSRFEKAVMDTKKKKKKTKKRKRNKGITGWRKGGIQDSRIGDFVVAHISHADTYRTHRQMQMQTHIISTVRTRIFISFTSFFFPSFTFPFPAFLFFSFSFSSFFPSYFRSSFPLNSFFLYPLESQSYQCR